MKKFFTALDKYAGDRTPEVKQEVIASMSAAYSKIDKAVKRGVLQRNNGAHKKSRLAAAFKKVETSLPAA